MSLRAFESWGLDDTVAPAGWEVVAHPPTILLTGGRFADGCLEMGGSRVIGLQRTFDPQRTWFVGFPIKTTTPSTSSFFGLLSVSGYQIGVALSTSGLINVYESTPYSDPGAPTLLGTGTHPISSNVWYFIEIGAYIDAVAGSVQVYVNGVLDIDLSGVDTQPQAVDTADTVLLGGLVSNTTFSVGTPYVCDDQGGENDTFLGDCRVIAQVPTGDGTYSDWTPSMGVTQYELVDEIPPDGGTTYVSSNTLNGMDTFTFNDLGVVGSVIAVKVCINAEKDETGVRLIAPVIRQLGTDYTYADIAPSAMSYDRFSEIFPVRPSDSNPWQVSDLGSGGAEFGVVVTG